MHRRDIIRSLFFGAASAKALVANSNTVSYPNQEPDSAEKFNSKWHLYPDMIWTGEDLWAQRLQDFYIKDGELQCITSGVDRTIHILTHQLSAEQKSFSAEMQFRFLTTNQSSNSKQNYAGFKLGVKGRFEDYRSAIITGKGIDVGVSRDGFLFIGKAFAEKQIEESILTSGIKLQLVVTSQSSGEQYAKLKALDKYGNTLGTVNSREFSATNWQGNIAIVSHFKVDKEKTNEPTISVASFSVSGKKLEYHPQQVYGAIYFAQYTVNNKILKLTAQLAPLDIAKNEVNLYIKKSKGWIYTASSSIHPLARIANFKITNWDTSSAYQYKVEYILKLKNGKKQTFTYEGTIAAEPTFKENVKALGFSCNWDLGFPDNEVVKNALTHNADIAFFLGDQFYESNGGFGIQTTPLENACLDYLRKWYQFGWSYRNVFRNIPMAALPDDHDMYHGNIWGSNGRPTTPLYGGASSQDSGGYKMLPEWVNMAQLTQTSHMPDAFDATPVLQSINVYYTQWQYGGINFAIVEDRKFKSAPKDVLPADAKVYNGYAENPAYNESKVKLAETQLLGERQMHFLSKWKQQKNKNQKFNVLVSATPFCCLQTLPAGTKNDQDTPNLYIPKKNEYVKGDLPTKDMDSNGWPHYRRDEVLRLLGNHVHLHLVGDQHLPSVVQYGVDSYNDSMYCFAVPALSNIWPRRWWPTVDENHQPLNDKQTYTGNFEDGFRNKITVHAVANPHQTNKQPATLYDRVTGYGVVEFNKAKEEIIINCWPRYVNPIEDSNVQYLGWPFTIKNKNTI